MFATASITVCLCLAFGRPERLDAASYTVLHHFSTGEGSGSFGLVASPEALYGTLEYGGMGDAGVIFAVETNGIFTNLYDFTMLDASTSTNRDGADPEAELIVDGNMLYGTAAGGGWGNSGTVYALTADGKNFTVLHQFTQLTTNTVKNSDGSSPSGPLVLWNGVLYGTTAYGGSSGYGTVFAIETNGSSFWVLHNFTGGTKGVDGANPRSGLTVSGGTLYGTTVYGGVGFGTVFAVTTDSHYTNLYSFSGGVDGESPYTGLVLKGDMLYGTMSVGGNAGDGLVFAIGTNGSNFRVVHSFSAGALDGKGNYTNSDGINPIKGLTLKGSRLYGSALSGGSFNEGTVFALNTDGSNFETLHSFTPTHSSVFTNSDGAAPYGRVALIGSTLYGITDQGGVAGNGTVFSITLPASAPPKLSIKSIDGARVVLTWPVSFSGFALESTARLSPAQWNDVTPDPVIINGQNTVTNAVTENPGFYRLRQ
jgi:uncharacterized repeat protein (TIGR03803 family)